LGSSRRRIEYNTKEDESKKRVYNYQYVVGQIYEGDGLICRSFGNVHDDQAWVKAYEYKKGKIEEQIKQLRDRLEYLDEEIELKRLCTILWRGLNNRGRFEVITLLYLYQIMCFLSVRRPYYLYITRSGKQKYIILRFSLSGEHISISCGRVDDHESWEKAKRHLRSYLDKNVLVLMNMLRELESDITEKREQALLADKFYNFNINDPPPARVLRKPSMTAAHIDISV